MITQLYYLTVFLSILCVVNSIFNTRSQCAEILKDYGIVGRFIVLLMTTTLCFIPLFNIFLILGAFKDIE